jgi:hypothetical protein
MNALLKMNLMAFNIEQLQDWGHTSNQMGKDGLLQKCKQAQVP